jgi:phage FluMu protein Com
MIIHNCIKCNYLELIPIANGQLTCFQKYICPKCKTIQWIKHSRVNPETYAQSKVIVNEKKKTIEIK